MYFKYNYQHGNDNRNGCQSGKNTHEYHCKQKNSASMAMVIETVGLKPKTEAN
jgi:hypothetical protein